MTAKQITSKLSKTNINVASLEISRDRVDVWGSDYAETKRIARKVAKTLGWNNTSISGNHAWVEASTLDLGDWNDKTSRWHY